MTEIVIGLDLGSSSVKAVAYHRSGRPIGTGRAPTPCSDRGLGIDFPVPGLIEAARTALREAANGNPVVGVGLTSMGEVGAVVAADGSWQGRNFPAWHDQRGAAAAQRLRTEFPLVNAQSGGHVRATSSLAKLTWLRGRGEVGEGIFLGLCGLLAQAWTGEGWQEASLAATSGAYDPVAGEWITSLWDAAGLDRVRLPEVRPPGFGTLARGPWAEADGVAGALVVIAGHDHPVAAVGTGSAAGSVVDSVGTGEPVLAAWTRELPTPQQTFQLVADGLTVETWPSTGDPLLIWEGLRPGLAMDAVLGASPFGRDALEDAGAAEEPVEPFRREETTALERGDLTPLRSRRLGPDSTAAQWRAAWAGLLAAYAGEAARGERVVRAATGARGPLVVTGGGTRSDLWLAAKRGATDSELRVTPLTDTGTRGAAAIVGAALGWWPDAASMPFEDNE